MADEGRTPDESLRLAQAAASAGDLDGAREILTSAFGSEVLALPDARPARITQSFARVWNERGKRTVTVQLLDGRGGEAASAIVAEAVAALSGRATVIASGPTITLTVTYDEPASLLAAHDRLVAALPKMPELALLQATLSTRYLAWPVKETILSLESGYQERVDLGPAVRAWEAEAEKLEAAAAGVEASGQALDQVRAAVWRGDARGWRDLGALSRAVYETRVDEQGAGPDWLVARAQQFYEEGSLRRIWSIRPGETRQLEAAIVGWRYDRLALAALIGAALVLIVFTGAALIGR